VTLHVVSAGDGFRYYLNSVAIGDGDRESWSAVLKYYTEPGTPTGVWEGAGVAALGLQPGARVADQQFALLLGAGLHPVTGAALGQRFPVYRDADKRIAERMQAVDDADGPVDRVEAVRRIAAEEAAKKTRRAVAGFDYSFSMPKSASVLWGLSDAGMQQVIANAHHEAVTEVIGLFERQVAATRTGATVPANDGTSAGAVRQVGVQGVTAACFDHWDSRAGDPDLHTHVVISAKVQSKEDGRWLALDGRPAHAAAVAMSVHYDAILADILARDLGLDWDARDRGQDRNPEWAIATIPPALSKLFSQRANAIEAEKDRLAAKFTAEHGHAPSRSTVTKLRQQATLATRPGKRVRSLAQLVQTWRGQAEAELGEDPLAWSRRAAASVPPPLLRADDIPDDQIQRYAEAAVTGASERRATWTHWNLHTEATRQTMALRFASAQDRETVVERIADLAQNLSVRLTPDELAHTPARFGRADGTSQFRPTNSALFTSEAVYTAEEHLLALGRDTTAPKINPSMVPTVIDNPGGSGWLSLGDDQAEAIKTIAASGRRVDLLVGPAGAGKTTTLLALLEAWNQNYGRDRVVGLAPSATAAQVLADELGINCENTAKWLADHRNKGIEFPQGGLVIIDEASLCGTLALDQIATAGEQQNAKIVLVGDWAQLQAVQAGGAFHLLAADRGDAPELFDIHRFHNQWEKDASLLLRHGDVSAIEAYDQHGRIKEGDATDMREDAYQAWLGDLSSGLSSVLIAQDRDTVTDLNAKARTQRIYDGQVSPVGEAQLADGSRASKGDLIVTRLNQRRITAGRTGWVRNGDRWTVLAVNPDGSLRARRAGYQYGATVTLPAGYVADHVDLGYALTAFRTQGVTVDTAHVIADDTTTRENLYVALTRGRESNTCYVALDSDNHGHDVDSPDEAQTARQVLTRILASTGAEPSAHQAKTQEHKRWLGIGQLAAEYETIAATITEQPGTIEARLHARVAGQQVQPPRYIVGLIREPDGPMPDETRQALGERKKLIQQRATELVQQAGRDHAPWLADLGGYPADKAGQQRWWTATRTVAAYRDRWDITSHHALGTPPDHGQQLLDHRRARQALQSFRPALSPRADSWFGCDRPAERTTSLSL